MKITENYIEISENKIQNILHLAIVGANTVIENQEDREKAMEDILSIMGKAVVEDGELYEIRVVGDK
jgi:hypothetical protein